MSTCINRCSKLLTFWWIWVVPVGVFCSNLSVFTVCDSFRTLIYCYRTSNASGLRLCGSTNSSSRITCTFDLPSAFWMRRYMLILSHHLPPVNIEVDIRNVFALRAFALAACNYFDVSASAFWTCCFNVFAYMTI